MRWSLCRQLRIVAGPIIIPTPIVPASSFNEKLELVDWPMHDLEGNRAIKTVAAATTKVDRALDIEFSELLTSNS